MTVIVLNLHHRGPFQRELPRWLRWLLLDKIHSILCMPQSAYFSERNSQKDRSVGRRLQMKQRGDQIKAQLVSQVGIDALESTVQLAGLVVPMVHEKHPRISVNYLGQCASS